MIEEVVEDVLTPGGEGAPLGTTRPQDGEEGLVWEALAVHAGEVAKPAEATGAEQGLDGDKAGGLAK